MSSGGAAVAIVGTSAMAQVDDGEPAAAPAEDASPFGIEGSVPIKLRINGQSHSLKIDPRTTLLDCLRETVGLTGTKKGCDHGQCRRLHGPREWCMRALVLESRPGHGRQRDHDDRGLGYAGSDASHAGIICRVRCVPVRLLHFRPNHVGRALLKEPCGPDDSAVKELMSGNICRCGAYANIVSAIQQVRKTQ